METSYSFFLKRLFSRSILVYPGELDAKPKSTNAEYMLKLSMRKVEMWNFNKSKILLSSDVKESSSSAMVVRGENIVSTVETSRSSKKGCTFLYNADKYCWLPSGNYGVMHLYGPNNEIIAAYDQSETVKYRMGKARILVDVSDDFRLLVLFTCTMNHQSLAKPGERAEVLTGAVSAVTGM
ncbi:hypothetical protein EV183_005658 [Coemansia sp. RSA 2336]|nr:hypothetical protein EV183_005658 [Coemansia sp. RSA 2336]